MALTARLQQATLQFLAPKFVEGALSGNIGMGYFLRRAAKWRGSQETVAFKYQVNTNGGSFIGMDQLSAQAIENGILLTYNYKPNYISSVLPNSDIAGNETEQQVADLMERTVTSDQYDLGRILGLQFYGDGTGNGGKDILGLGAIVDDGTSVATIGGQSRATYPQLDATVTASGGTLSLAGMYASWDAAAQDSQIPTLILTSKTIRSLYNQLLEPKERYTIPLSPKDKLYMNTGAEELAFRSAPVFGDSLMDNIGGATSQTMFFLNENSFKFRSLPKWPGSQKIPFAMDAMEGEPTPDLVEGLNFHWTGWKQPTNQQGIIGQTILAGNFVVDNPRYNSKITGITAI